MDYQSLTDATCDRLRRAIIDGTFAPGEKLKERELASLIGVSTTPVKAALQRLALEGLVTSIPLRGSYVAEDIASILSEIGLIRSALEGTAAYLAALKASEEDRATLRAQLEVMEACTRDRDLKRAVDSNTRFHAIISDICGNHAVRQMLGVVREYDAILRPQVLADESQMDQGLQEHRAVFEAIAARDPEAADARMREHVIRNTQYLGRSLQRGAETATKSN
jgi:DNA-binding GntR family transcriptional regulator